MYHGLLQFFLLSFPASQNCSYIVLSCNLITVIPEFLLSHDVLSMLRTGKEAGVILTALWPSAVNKIQVIFSFCPHNWGRNWRKAWRRLSQSAFCLLPFEVCQQAFFRCKIMSCQDVYLYHKSFKFQLYK